MMPALCVWVSGPNVNSLRSQSKPAVPLIRSPVMPGEVIPPPPAVSIKSMAIAPREAQFELTGKVTGITAPGRVPTVVAPIYSPPFNALHRTIRVLFSALEFNA